MERIRKKSYKGELKYRGDVILKYNLEYPEIVDTKFSIGQMMFNIFNETKANRVLRKINGDLFEQAKNAYDFNNANGYPIMVFEVDLVYEVTYNENGFVSLYFDEYTYTGGAHGNTIRTSQNWNLRIGKQIGLEEAWRRFHRKDENYTNSCHYVIEILKSINDQIKERLEKNPGIYFDDYCTLVLETFNFDSFYIDKGCITIYFQQYDIAPYSTGIPTFCIK